MSIQTNKGTKWAFTLDRLCFLNWTTIAAPLQAIVVSVLPEFYLAEKQTTNKTDIKAKMTKTHFRF